MDAHRINAKTRSTILIVIHVINLCSARPQKSYHRDTLLRRTRNRLTHIKAQGTAIITTMSENGIDKERPTGLPVVALRTVFRSVSTTSSLASRKGQLRYT